jgi:hypothetical protein
MISMLENLREWLDMRVFEVIRSRTSVIKEINRKYAKPRIEMTRGVKVALLFLRLYLIFLVSVLGYAFVLRATGRA